MQDIRSGPGEIWNSCNVRDKQTANTSERRVHTTEGVRIKGPTTVQCDIPVLDWRFRSIR